MAHARRFVSLLVVTGLAGAAMVAGPGAGAEQTGPVVATQDAYVLSTATWTTYDTTELRVRSTAAQKLQGFVRFELRGVPAAATNLRATLRLSASPASQPGRVEVRTSGAFSERTVTWANRPGASAVQGSAVVTPGGTVELDAGPVTGTGVRSYALTAPAGQGAQLRFASSEDPDPARRPALTVTWTAPGPPVSDKLVPREGAWWGSYPGQAAGDVEAREAVYGRQVDILHRYHDWNDTWPTAEEQGYAAQGRFLFEGWESRVFGGATICWADIAAGAYDAAIDAQAERLAAVGSRLFVGFMHEPEDNLGPCQPGAVNDSKADMGSAEEFKAAWRHIVERVRPVAPNVVWVLSFMGHDPAASWALYPGDDVVDWVAWDPYACVDPGKPCGGYAELVNRTWLPDWSGFYDHARARYPDKPLMLAEWGVVDNGPPARAAAVFESVARDLAAFPEIKALVYFEAADSPVGKTRVDSSPAALAAFRGLASSPWFGQRPPG
jgi:hypothetical protein